jgi:hypothetical protein
VVGAVRALEFQPDLRIVAVETVIQYVDDPVPIDLQQLLAGLDMGFFGGTAGVHGRDDGTHGIEALSGRMMAIQNQFIISETAWFCKWRRDKREKSKEGRSLFPPNKDTRIDYLPAATDLMTLTSRPL